MCNEFNFGKPNIIEMKTAICIIVVVILLYFAFNKPQYYDKNDLLPTSGFEHSYFPLKWNMPPMLLTHNCYDYAFDNYNMFQKASSQPGYLPHSKPNESGNRMTCAGVNERLNSDHGDNISVASRDIPCEQGTYKIALIADPDDDYHFLRQNRDGTWSHKPGNTPVTNKDFSGRIITDPEKANFTSGDYNYSDFCNYFCVRRE